MLIVGVPLHSLPFARSRGGPPTPPQLHRPSPSHCSPTGVEDQTVLPKGPAGEIPGFCSRCSVPLLSASIHPRVMCVHHVQPSPNTPLTSLLPAGNLREPRAVGHRRRLPHVRPPVLPPLPPIVSPRNCTFWRVCTQHFWPLFPFHVPQHRWQQCWQQSGGPRHCQGHV